MATVNIGVSNDDLSYRYKMPKMKTKIEGRGNGIKTVIVNMVEISKSLHVAPQYPTKFFGMELGAQSKYDKATERAVVNGAHNAADLAVLLNKYISIFVLCPKCNLPETTLKVKKNAIKVDCAACGYNGLQDMKHKLASYMLKHPPVKKNKGKKSKEKKSKKSSKKSTEKSPEKSSVKKEKKSSKKEEAVVWYTDTSAEAQEARKLEELKSMGATGGEEDIEDRVQSIMGSAQDGPIVTTPEEQLREFLSADKTIAEITSELRRLEIANGFDSQEKLLLLLHTIFEGKRGKELMNAIEKHAELLETFCPDPATSRMLIYGVEKMIGLEFPELLEYAPVILKALYEWDVLEEDVILEWSESPAEASWLVPPMIAEEIRSLATPFVEWLKNAESDDE